MAYNDVTLDELEDCFGIKNRVRRLFDDIAPVTPSDWLSEMFSRTRDLPIRREKYRGEAIVFPVLLDLYRRNNNYFTIYSGESLNVNDRLNGVCDFILAKEVRSFDLQYPLLPVVQAEKNDLDLGVAPCAAQMLGTKLFNAKSGVALDAIYGCVTTGDYWLFMKLEDNLYIDPCSYYPGDLNKTLAVFQSIIDYYKAILP